MGIAENAPFVVFFLIL